MISSPDVLLGDDKTLICIAIAREEDAISVRTRLNREYGVDAEREIGYFDLVWDLYQRDMDIQTGNNMDLLRIMLLYKAGRQ